MNGKKNEIRGERKCKTDQPNQQANDFVQSNHKKVASIGV